MDILVPLLLFLAVVILDHTKKGRELQEKRRREQEEGWEESEAWQRGLEDRVRQAEETRKLSFEIPTMRPSEEGAETKLPQADRIFARREEKAMPSDAVEAVTVTEVERTPLPKMPSINLRYQEQLRKKPSVKADEAMPPEEQSIEPIAANEERRYIPTSRDRLVEGIILAEVLGKPKAYQNHRRI